MLGLPEGGIGVSEVLAGDTSWKEALRDTPVENLRIVGAGGPALRPSELVSSDQMRLLIDQLREEADLVLIDGAPVLLVSDAVALARSVDGVLLVADARRARAGAIARAAEELRMAGARLVGAVLANARRRETDGAVGWRAGRAYSTRHRGNAVAANAPSDGDGSEQHDRRRPADVAADEYLGT